MKVNNKYNIVIAHKGPLFGFEPTPDKFSPDNSIHYHRLKNIRQNGSEEQLVTYIRRRYFAPLCTHSIDKSIQNIWYRNFKSFSPSSIKRDFYVYPLGLPSFYNWYDILQAAAGLIEDHKNYKYGIIPLEELLLHIHTVIDEFELEDVYKNKLKTVIPGVLKSFYNTTNGKINFVLTESSHPQHISLDGINYGYKKP